MIEGQMGLNWPRWQKIVRAVEDFGFAGLFRSDHFTNAHGPDEASLELWVSLTWLASHTQRIEFGPMVTPMSFRNPVFTARMGYQVDDLSNGRLILGVGAGWQDREHHKFGFDLLDVHERMNRFTEGIEVVTRLIRSPEPVEFTGRYYQLREAQLLPRPQHPTPILLGGNGMKRTLPLVARYANEWNGVYLTPARFTERSTHLSELLQAEGRDPSSVRRSIMTGLVFGRDEPEYREKLGQHNFDELREHGLIAGTPDMIPAQLAELAEAGCQRIMLQWFDLDNLDSLEALAKAIL